MQKSFGGPPYPDLSNGHITDISYENHWLAWQVSFRMCKEWGFWHSSFARYIPCIFGGSFDCPDPLWGRDWWTAMEMKKFQNVKPAPFCLQKCFGSCNGDFTIFLLAICSDVQAFHQPGCSVVFSFSLQCSLQLILCYLLGASCFTSRRIDGTYFHRAVL